MLQKGMDWRVSADKEKESERPRTAGQRYANKRKPGGDDFSVL